MNRYFYFHERLISTDYMKHFSLIALLLLYTGISLAQNSNLQFRSQITYPFECANIWGYVDAQGNEYALVGTKNGLSICDVTQPDSITELFAVPHNINAWREVKTYANRAYVVNEAGGGVLIVDLSQLPDTVSYHSFTGYGIKTAHTLWIDEFGKLYLMGYNTNANLPEQQRGIMILDLTTDPDNPTLLGTWNGAYVHDGFVRGDTAWLGLIIDGKLGVLDVTNPQNVQIMALQNTPSLFCHNAWPTSDNHYVFTTDEKPNSFLTCYDVSSLNNIMETDRIQSNPGNNVIVHNVLLLNDDYAWVSYYRDGVVLFDVSDKENMVQVANYDTSPLSGSGFNGDWGVYPYLPSGNIILSDIENGLFVLTPTYVKAARIQGVITNSVSGSPINNVLVNISGTAINKHSNINGIYKSGMMNGGTYNLHFSCYGYEEQTVPVTLYNDSTVVLNIQLIPLPSFSQSFTIIDSVSNQPLPFAQLLVTDYGSYNFEVIADANGVATINTFYAGVYDAIIGVWGHKTKLFSNLSLTSSTNSYTAKLSKGYYDDFYFDFGWTTGTNPPVGQWVRDVPNATYYNNIPCNPNQDVVGDFGAKCYVTGNAVSNSAGDDDVDDGCVILISPTFDLSNYNNPLIKYSRWFCNTGSTPSPNDSMTIIINNGIESKAVDIVTPTGNASELSKWIDKSIMVKSFITLTSNMKLYVRVCDIPPPHLVEGGFDYFRIIDTTNMDYVEDLFNEDNLYTVYPNPTEDYIYISSSNKITPIITFTDITGRNVKEISSYRNNSKIDISDIPPGVYFIRMIAASGNRTVKLIKL